MSYPYRRINIDQVYLVERIMNIWRHIECSTKHYRILLGSFSFEHDGSIIVHAMTKKSEELSFQIAIADIHDLRNNLIDKINKAEYTDVSRGK